MLMQLRSFAVIAALVFVGGASAKAADNTPAENGAIRHLEAHAEIIAGFAYPTVTHIKSEYDGGVRERDGAFKLTYAYRGSWSDSTGYFSLNFHYNRDGRLLRISDGPRSWFFPPFTTSDVLLEVVKAVIEEEPELRDDAAIQAVMRTGSVRKILVEIINVKAGKS